MRPYVKEFVQKFPKMRSHSQKVILIDTLIHQFHWSVGRPAAPNLIEGKAKDIMPFLDNLTYGEHVPEDAYKTREEWRRVWSEKVNKRKGYNR